MSSFLNLLIVVLIVLAALSIFYWGAQRLALPAPVMTIVQVGLAIVGLIFLVSLLTGTFPSPVFLR